MLLAIEMFKQLAKQLPCPRRFLPLNSKVQGGKTYVIMVAFIPCNAASTAGVTSLNTASCGANWCTAVKGNDTSWHGTSITEPLTLSGLLVLELPGRMRATTEGRLALQAIRVSTLEQCQTTKSPAMTN